MALMSALKRLVPGVLKQQVRERVGVPTMAGRMKNLAAAGFSCSGAIDGGAYAGDWSRLCRQIFSCPVLAVEPLPRDGMRKLLASDSGVSLSKLALSDEVKQSATFVQEETNSRFPDAETLATEGIDVTQVATERLENLLGNLAFTPNLLKLDLQGAELKALRGAEAVLEQFEVVICEMSLIPIGGVPEFCEVSDWLQARNYRLYDFLPAYYRPLDHALWQADAFFVRRNSALVKSTQWD
ncbi:MAG: FkbM family methyltransferase [Lysobacterales bacterium]